MRKGLLLRHLSPALQLMPLRDALPDTRPSQEEMNYVEMELTDEQKASLPTNWDWRDHMPGTPAKAADALNQGSCGSCWAFGAATTMAYRLNIASNGKYNAVPSPQVRRGWRVCLVSCEGVHVGEIHRGTIRGLVHCMSDPTM